MLERLKNFKDTEMRQVSAISNVAFHEIIREKIMWSAFLFGLLSVVLAFLVSRLSFTDNARIALDFGLASISIITSLIAVIMGSAIISKEITQRTHFLVLSKPILRWQFIIGRYYGLIKVITLNLILMSVILVLVMSIVGGGIYLPAFKGIYLFIFQYALLSSVACIFSSFTTAVSSAVFTSGIWVIGHVMTDIRILSEKMEPHWIRPVLKAVSHIMPDLNRFDLKAEISHQVPISASYLLGTTAYGLSYVIFALLLACLIFRKREL